MKTQKKLARSSNIELLRIVSMFLIVLHHFSVHGPWKSVQVSGALFGASHQLLSFGGKIGVIIFVLITGYFMVRSRFKVLSLLRIVFQTLFYSWLILAAFTILDHGSISHSSIKAALFPLFSNEYWFISTYVLMYLLIPLLNKLLNQLSRQQRGMYLSIGFVILSLIPTLGLFTYFAGNITLFVFFYCLGASIKLDFSEKVSSFSSKIEWLNPAAFCSRWPVPIAIVSGLFIVGSIVLIEYLRVKSGFTAISVRYFEQAHSAMAILFGLSLFIIFTRLEVPSSPLINAIGGATLGVYLIHDNPFVRSELWPHFKTLWSGNPFMFISEAILVCFAIFAICALVDILRKKLLEDPLFNAIRKRFGQGVELLDSKMML